MRLFVAVDLDDPARSAAAGLAEDLKRRAGASARDASWTSPANYHLTLRFVGEVGEETAESIRTALSGAVAQVPFDVSFGRVGAFPSVASPRVIWIGATDGAGELVALHAAIDARLAQQGVPADTRPFSAHLTLARLRRFDRRVFATYRRAIEAASPVSLRWRTDRVTLYQSRLSPKGSQYTALACAALDGIA